MNKYVDNPFKSPAILSFCPGMLGLERGIDRAFESLWRDYDNQDIDKSTIQKNNDNRIRIAAYVEIETFINWNLVSQMEKGLLDPAPIWSDIKTFDPRPFRGKIHGIIGGYPCQPFSVAGQQKGENDPRHLWPYIREHIRATGPAWCLFENVPGHLNIGYEAVRQELSELGYTVKEGIYSAEEVGAPHQRKRLFILAISENFGCRRRSGEECGANQWHFFSKKSQGDSARSEAQRCCGSYLANSNDKRLQGWHGAELSECPRECTARPSSAFSGWPARPGQEQYDWEESRIESRLGFTVNGYNFREDLLRMAGNAVVEQTAEIAVIDLLRKHGIING